MTVKIVNGVECHFDPYEGSVEIWVGNDIYLGTAKDEEEGIRMVNEYFASDARKKDLTNTW